MIYAIMYDPITGEITGRVSAPDSAALRSYGAWLQITREEFDARPEENSKVDVSTGKLVNKGSQLTV